MFKSRFLAMASLIALMPALAPALAQERAPEPPVPPPVPVTILSKAVTANVATTDQALLNADSDQDNWLLHGRTYDNQRFSPLTQITRDNVKRLAIKTIIHTGQINSTEVTPLVVDGIMYLSTPNDHVQAYDAVSGELKWSYNPVLGYTDNCCGPQSRGVAVAYGKVFVAQLDGHVVALDAKTGAVVWKSVIADTIPAPSHYYAFTMAPQVFNGMVVVGNSRGISDPRLCPGFGRQHRQIDLAFLHHRRAESAWRQDMERGQLEIWRQLGVEHAGDRSQKQSGVVRHRQSQSGLLGRKSQGR